MQTELLALGLPVNVQLLGVNAAGLESGNAFITMGRTLPWLQDTDEKNVWASWGAVWRDVWILDGENVPIAIYNLTEHNLADAANYTELKGMLEAAANAENQ